ncbi:MAG: DNA repair protein RecO [Gammaproteobacteria bacterium]|nr:DNA repair protein RecO [Gammaproteobacteria bacterium]
MTNKRVQLQPAYVLHQRAYRDTSALLEIFTPEHGRVGVVGRGVRAPKSRRRALLQPFQPLLISWNQRGELGSLAGVEAQGQALRITSAFIASGFYLNELLMRLLVRDDAQMELFGMYDATLRAIALVLPEDEVALEILLRRFELQLLKALGYGLVLDRDAASGGHIEPDAAYRYVPERGAVLATELNRDDGIPIAGSSLLSLARGELMDRQARSDAKRLLRGVLARYLGPRPLQSRQLLRPRATPSTTNVREPGAQQSTRSSK